MGCTWFSGKVISWFESYLSARTFKVSTDKKFSDSGKILIVAFPKDLY